MEILKLLFKRQSGVISHSLKVVFSVIIILALVWLAVSSRFNLGKIVRMIFGDSGENEKNPKVSNYEGEVTGEVIPFERVFNPFRDKSIIKLANGDVIKLPPNVIDEDVQIVIKGKAEVYDVKISTKRFTAIFDSV